jgi:dihydroflavonol-4-reductase
MAKKRMFASHAKAAQELGYAPGPVEEALARAVGWFCANGYVTP